MYVEIPRLISAIDVVGPMNPYQPYIPFHILSFMLAEIAKEKKYLRGIWIFSEIDQYERKCIC